MEHSQELKSIKNLLGESFGFLKLNWKKIFKFILPVYGSILISTLLFYGLKFIQVENTVIVYGLIFALLILSTVVFVLKFSTLITPMLIRDMVNKNEGLSPIAWYKDNIKILPRLFGVFLLVLFLNILTFGVLIIIAFLIFTLPVILTVLAFKLGMTGVGRFLFDIIADNNVSIVLLITLSLFVAVGSFMFCVWNFFTLYVSLFEKRRGLDAITTGFLLIKGRFKKIFARFIVLSAIGFIPFLVLLLPLEIKIFIDGVRNMIFQYVVLGLPPVFTVPPIHINILRDVLGILSATIALPLFSTMGYFLWKDVETTTLPFDQKRYENTRKWLKRSFYIGSIALVLFVVVLITISMFAPVN